MRTRFPVLFIIALAMLALPLPAQEMEAARAEISWPPPVYVLSGDVSLSGTVNPEGMSRYFIEYRALDDDLTAPDTRQWLPVTLPASDPVVDDLLGTWNTASVDDGLYQLRLSVILADESTAQHIVGPLRVENAMMAADSDDSMMMETDEDMATDVMPAPEEETPVPDETPRVTARVNANVRAGDSISFRPIDALLRGESAPILGTSSRGTAWFQIALPGGGRGWISETVVLVSGMTDNLPRIVPPPLPAPQPLPPTPVPLPASLPDLIVQDIEFDDNPECDTSFRIEARIVNVGQGASTASGNIGVQDWHINTGTPTSATVGGFPPLAPGEHFIAIMNLTVSTYYKERHRLTITVDSTNMVAESNEGNNSGSRDYELERSGC